MTGVLGREAEGPTSPPAFEARDSQGPHARAREHPEAQHTPAFLATSQGLVPREGTAVLD